VALVRLKPRRGRLTIIAGDSPYIVVPASHLIYQGPTASPRPQERPVFDRGRVGDYQRKNGNMPIFNLRGFLCGLGRADLSGVLERAYDLGIELEGWGRLRLEGITLTTWTLRPEPHGLWVELAGQVEGAVKRMARPSAGVSEIQK